MPQQHFTITIRVDESCPNVPRITEVNALPLGCPASMGETQVTIQAGALVIADLRERRHTAPHLCASDYQIDRIDEHRTVVHIYDDTVGTIHTY